MTYTTIRPGQVWLDTNGQRIQAHGGSIFFENGTFYWYGENKEKTVPGSGIWHWGVRCYSSKDLYNWQDLGLIIPPVTDDPTSALHPSSFMDRPHILFNKMTGKYVAWLKIMEKDGGQRSTVLTADRMLGPYTIVRTGYRPLDMNAGDLDMVVDPVTNKGYYYFEKVHTELICADLTDDYTAVTGTYSSHFPRNFPPYVREAPAHFYRNGLHYLFTSGTTGYHPNPSEVACAPDYHGPWKLLGNPHVNDPSESSFRSQITSVFKHPYKQDLYIALADRWLVDYPAVPGMYRYLARMYESIFNKSAPQLTQEEGVGIAGVLHNVPPSQVTPEMLADMPPKSHAGNNTSIADYVWLPVRFDGEMAYLDWHDEWRVEDYK
ncbi:MAG: family 43 glycosylhydrolase [Anaerolineae bacterium]